MGRRSGVRVRSCPVSPKAWRRGGRALRRSARRRHGRVTRSRPRSPAGVSWRCASPAGAWWCALCERRARRLSDSAPACRRAAHQRGREGRLGTPPGGARGFMGPAPRFRRPKGVSATPVACPIAVAVISNRGRPGRRDPPFPRHFRREPQESAIFCGRRDPLFPSHIMA